MPSFEDSLETRFIVALGCHRPWLICDYCFEVFVHFCRAFLNVLLSPVIKPLSTPSFETGKPLFP